MANVPLDPPARISDRNLTHVSADPRCAERVTLMFRTANLIAEGHQILCIIRNISQSGVRLEFFHPIAQTERYILDAGNGRCYGMTLVWIDRNSAGFQFDAAINITEIVKPPCSGYPRRPTRLAIRSALLFHGGGRVQLAYLRDLSMAGACVETNLLLAEGDEVQISLVEEQTLMAQVRWCRSPYIGVKFYQPMSLKDCARLANHLQICNNNAVSCHAAAFRA